mmetsp:Transcript_10882/g.67225  ORF Transcript_10882/g.67225 Transcript_10882/m.67225 type:complete len:93 (+) Transcript_10882:3297-3575(+)
MSDMAFFDHTALILKVRLDSIAVTNPIQLNDSSAAEAIATPSMIGKSDATIGSGVFVPKKIDEVTTLNTGSKVFTVWVREIATAANEMLAAI